MNPLGEYESKMATLDLFANRVVAKVCIHMARIFEGEFYAMLLDLLKIDLRKNYCIKP